LNPNKKPYTKNGFYDATTDEAQIRDWWRKYPEAGIGIPTGNASGWILLDIDPDKGGDVALSALVLEYGDLPPTSHAKTPRGGDHYYFKNPTDIDVRNSESKLGKGVDIRGNGGYAAVPGCDASRRWTNPETLLADAPAWLVELAIAKKKREPAKPEKAGSIIAFAGTHIFYEGERHSGLRGVACGRRVHDWAKTEDELVEQVLQVNAARCVPPLPEDEATELATSAWAKYNPHGEGATV
jgi:putative DNA primase/helicase